MRRTVTAVCVAALLLTAGCSGLGGGDGAPTTTASSPAERIQRQSTDAMRDVSTYHVSMRMDLSANDRTLTMTNDGVYDRDARTARMNMSVYGTDVEAYLDDTTMYLNARGRWVVRNASGRDPWVSGNTLAQQRDLLASADLAVVGGDTVNGTAVTVLRLEPEPDDLKDLVAQQQGQNFQDVTIEDATYRMYVANETHRLRRMEMTMEMTVNGQTATADMTARYDAYNEPVDVTIPDAAKQAAEDDGTDSTAAARAADETAGARATSA